jgi:hypothetical protein
VLEDDCNDDEEDDNEKEHQTGADDRHCDR